MLCKYFKYNTTQYSVDIIYHYQKLQLLNSCNTTSGSHRFLYRFSILLTERNNRFTLSSLYRYLVIRISKYHKVLYHEVFLIWTSQLFPLHRSDLDKNIEIYEIAKVEVTLLQDTTPRSSLNKKIIVTRPTNFCIIIYVTGIGR